MSEVYKRDFDTIQVKFINLVLQVSKILKKSHVSLKKLKTLLTSIPILKSPLKGADTIDKVMQVVQQHSSFINCSYLEAITDRFSVPAARKEIDAYYNFVEEFCHHTLTQHSYVTSFFAKQSTHLISSENITLKLEWNPDEKTLIDIQGLLRKTFHSLASHIHIVVIGGGSVTVICYAPQYLMGALAKLAKESRKTLVENRVTYLSVGYAVLLDGSAQAEVNGIVFSTCHDCDLA